MPLSKLFAVYALSGDILKTLAFQLIQIIRGLKDPDLPDKKVTDPNP